MNETVAARVTTGQRIFFAAVAALALWVGFWGYFAPPQVNRAIPWLVPPLHARFLGAMYLSGAAAMIGCIVATRWAQVRAVVSMAYIWTGMLFIVSLFHVEEFDFTKIQVWIWFGAYLIYPLIALWLSWTHSDQARRKETTDSTLPSWTRRYLLIQGYVVTLLALALLLAPGFMTNLWPWKITRLLAQIYSAPFLAYGLGCLWFAHERSWSEIRVGVTATLVFAAGVLLASYMHRNLFSAADIADWLWFIGFAVATVMFGMLTIGAFRSLKSGEA
ncbi:MAG: hypothetical protein HYY46_07880 [Deltaproteobacteria bacterium]|nr:hypothetical protein [Deltaproteobacteria bacterium]